MKWETKERCVRMKYIYFAFASFHGDQKLLVVEEFFRGVARIRSNYRCLVITNHVDSNHLTWNLETISAQQKKNRTICSLCFCSTLLKYTQPFYLKQADAPYGNIVRRLTLVEKLPKNHVQSFTWLCSFLLHRKVLRHFYQICSKCHTP